MIPFNRAYIAKNQLEYINKALKNNHISGDGPFTKECHEMLESQLDVEKVLLTTNCTHALEIASLLLDLKPGDEIITPSFTFVSTVNAFVLRGAVPVFVDIRPDTLNIDEALIEEKITEQTRAIFVVHYAGVGCEMDSILNISEKYNIPIIEDNAHGLYGKYKQKNLGTFGCMATQSFHETKNISCGEGGALIINDPGLIDRAEIIREKGTNRSRFFRGQVDKYTWVDVGSSYLPSEILAAVLCAQLEEYKFIQKRRSYIWKQYFETLSEWAEENSVKLPYIPDYCSQSYHMFYMQFPNLKTRQDFIGYLKGHGVHAVFHYIPLHTSEMGMKYGYTQGELPITESVSDRLVRLPFFVDLSESDQGHIVKTIWNFSL